MRKIPEVPFLLYLIIAFTCFCSAKAQNTIDWSPGVRLQLSDFQSPATHIGGDMASLYSAAGMDFFFEMTRAEFMFTKNWNTKVNCTFSRDASSLVAPDEATAQGLVNYAQYGFDLAELYARKFRKQLHDNKKAFSEASFARPIFEALQKEYVKQLTLAGRITNMGRKAEVLEDLRNHVLQDIETFPDYCKTCKPEKKR